MLRLTRSRLVAARSAISPLAAVSRNSKGLSAGIQYSRRYASSKQAKTGKDDLPSFKKLIMIGIVGTAIFVKTVGSLDKNKHKTSFSEAEYQQVVNGLKRRVALFQPGEIDMQLTTIDNIKDAKAKMTNEDPTAKFIDPKDVVEEHRTNPDDRYKALLDNIYAVFGKDYVHNLPEGLLVNLLVQYVKDNVNQGDKVVIVDFPRNLKDASIFESEVAVASKITVPKSESESDVCKYFDTVDKVVLV